MSNNNFVLELFRDLKEDRIDQLIQRFNRCDSLSKGDRENILRLETSTKEQCNSSYNNRIEEIDQPFLDFLFLYLRWQHERNATNDYDPFKKLLRASEQLRQMLRVMKGSHRPLMKFLTKFIQISKIASKKALDYARQNLKDENRFMSDLEQHYQTWISLINKEIKDAECLYKSQIVLKIYNIQLGIRFQKYDYVGCQSIITHTKKYQSLPNEYLVKEPKSSQVAYMYYFGRLQIFSQDFTEAANCLQFALDHAPAAAYSQRRQILKYLIPVNMYCGKFASVALIEKYQLYEYLQLGIAIQEGNIAKLEQQREQWKKCWIKRSLYLFIGMLEMLTIRNLCKRVIFVMAACKTEKSFNIDIEKFKAAFEFSAKRPFEIEEVACILGNLFYQKKYLNGLIHKTAKSTLVVLSLNNACPKIKPAS